MTQCNEESRCEVIIHPDIPSEVSLNYLARLEKDAPYTWYAQPKYDGRRRIIGISDDDGYARYTYRAKNKEDREDLPAALRAAFEGMDWERGTMLDCEWVGPRHKDGDHRLFLFDILYRNGASLLKTPFDERVAHLQHAFDYAQTSISESRIEVAPFFRNPGLVERYQEQLTNPISEGLVVRRFDSTVIGSTVKCAVNPHWCKVKFKRIKE